MSSSTKLALVGCGAVSQQLIVPALAEIPNCTVEWFVDTNMWTARRAREKYGYGNVTDNYLDTVSKVDAAIVAVPNYLHSKVSTDFLKAGRDVLCEKPIADNGDNAVEMIKASKYSGARLSVNLLRRRLDCCGTARSILNQGILGKVNRIECEEGHPTTWPFSSSYILHREKSGGGVLIDVGVHSIDLLGWLFGSDLRLISYRDDSLGGIESNCEIDFLINSGQDEIPCQVRLSYTRRLGNRLTIVGNQCGLEIRQSDLTGVYLRVAGFESRIGRAETQSYVPYFRDQIVSFLSKSVDERLAGEDALNSLLFIEDCYRKRQRLTYPWEEPARSEVGRSTRTRFRKVLVVGASGFLGTRLVERLTLDLNAPVRGTVHKPQHAIRLARLPVELFDCDLLERSQVMDAVAGCDVVINCAAGRLDTSGDAKTESAVYVRGTENLLEAAEKHAVKRFVHISTAAVYGFKQNRPLVDESCRLKASTTYVRDKIASDKLVAGYARHASAVILRPTLIYGPYSQPWAVGIIDRLTSARPTFVENGGVANLVYVDDVVDAILAAIESEEADGKALIINNDREVVRWRDYVLELSKICNTAPKAIPAGNLGMQRLKQTIALFADSLRACSDVLRSPEMLTLLARIPMLVVLGSKLVKGQRRKEIEAKVSARRETSQPDLRGALAKYETMDRPLYEVATCHAVFSASMAKTTLGWRPHTTFLEGSRKTREWASWAGLC